MGGRSAIIVIPSHRGPVVTYSVSAREFKNFTWDAPLGRKTIRWNFPAASQVHNKKTINVTKVSEPGRQDAACMTNGSKLKVRAVLLLS